MRSPVGPGGRNKGSQEPKVGGGYSSIGDKKTTQVPSNLSWQNWVVIVGVAFAIVLLGLLSFLVNRESSSSGTSDGVVHECCFSSDCEYPDENDCWTHFLVLGTGTGGSTAAYLLSDYINEESGKRFGVVAIERGQNHNSDFLIRTAMEDDVPYFLFPGDTSRYTATFLQNSMTNLPGFRNVITNGNMLGGGSNADYCVDIFPSPNRMAQMATFANSGEDDIQWDYDTVRSVIEGFENFSGCTNCTRGKSGLLDTTGINANPDAEDATYKIIDAIIENSPVDESTITHAWDYNCPHETSFTEYMQQFWTRLSLTHYLRSSPAINYFTPNVVDSSGYGVDDRKLRIITDATATSFHTNQFGEADYVDIIVKGNNKRRIYARRRIILALGALGTSSFVERSGYGDPTVLANANIPLIKSVPGVGENFQMHYGTTMVFTTTQTVGTSFFVSAMGLLSVLPEYEGMRSAQIYISTQNLGLPAALINDLGLNNLPNGTSAVYVAISILAPESRGSVHISSSGAMSNPTVNFDAYGDENGLDLNLISNLTTIVYNAVVSLQTSDSPFEYGVIYPPPSLFCGPVPELQTYIKASPFFQNHYAGTMSMGSVLDANLAMVDVKGVSVVDCSFMPVISNGNTRIMPIIAAHQVASHLIATVTSA